MTITLPAMLTAGMPGAQVVQPGSISSNIEAFVLTPQLTAWSALNVQGTGSAPRTADIQLTVNPAIGSGQQLLLLLNQVGTSVAYSVIVAPQTPAPPPSA